jgi:hypothetical protein
MSSVSCYNRQSGWPWPWAGLGFRETGRRQVRQHLVERQGKREREERRQVLMREARAEEGSGEGAGRVRQELPGSVNCDVLSPD